MNFGYQEAIVAIADCAFVTSEYPVILSFENHCCRAQQYKLAKYSEEMFGEFLGKDPVPGYPVTHFLTPLYSPPNTFSIKCPNRIKCSWLINWICMFFFLWIAGTGSRSSVSWSPEAQDPHQEQASEAGYWEIGNGTLPLRSVRAGRWWREGRRLGTGQCCSPKTGIHQIFHSFLFHLIDSVNFRNNSNSIQSRWISIRLSNLMSFYVNWIQSIWHHDGWKCRLGHLKRIDKEAIRSIRERSWQAIDKYKSTCDYWRTAVAKATSASAICARWASKRRSSRCTSTKVAPLASTRCSHRSSITPSPSSSRDLT